MRGMLFDGLFSALVKVLSVVIRMLIVREFIQEMGRDAFGYFALLTSTNIGMILFDGTAMLSGVKIFQDYKCKVDEVFTSLSIFFGFVGILNGLLILLMIEFSNVDYYYNGVFITPWFLLLSFVFWLTLPVVQLNRSEGKVREDEAINLITISLVLLCMRYTGLNKGVLYMLLPILPGLIKYTKFLFKGNLNYRYSSRVFSLVSNRILIFGGEIASVGIFQLGLKSLRTLIIGRYSDLGIVAAWKIFEQILSIPTMIVSTVNNALFPSLRRMSLTLNHLPRILSLSGYVVMVGLVLVALAVPKLYAYISNESIDRNTLLWILIALGSLFQLHTSPFGMFLISTGDLRLITKQVLVCGLISLFVLMVGSFTSLSFYAAIASLISFNLSAYLYYLLFIFPQVKIDLGKRYFHHLVVQITLMAIAFKIIIELL